MVEINALFAGYGKKEILHNISLHFDKGEITTIIGPNGCGKSTLLKSIIGLTDIKNGKICLKNEMVAYLAQSKNIPDITVGTLVLHGRFPYLSFPRRYSKEDIKIADDAMKKMGILHLKDSNISTLSGGQRQKAYIAMALCQQANTILLDEPTTYLDIAQQFKLGEVLKELRDDKKAIVCVFHDIILALKISDKIVVMENGSIKAIGTPAQILESSVIPEVFDIDIMKVGTEYFYRQRKEL